MADTFTQRVRAAAGAGWGTVIILAVALTAGWVVAVLLMSTRPKWAPALCGGHVTWDTLQVMYLWGFGAIKVMLWAILMATIWLTLWGRRLQRAG